MVSFYFTLALANKFLYKFKFVGMQFFINKSNHHGYLKYRVNSMQDIIKMLKKYIEKRLNCQKMNKVYLRIFEREKKLKKINFW